MTRSATHAALLGFIATLGLVGAYLTPLGSMLDDWMHSSSGPASWGAWGPLAFVPISGLAVALGIPRLLLATVAGALFGFALGCVSAQAGALLGCTLTFAAGRWLGREWVESRMAGRSQRIQRLFALAESHGIACNLLIRSAPVGNFFVTNLLLSVSRMKTWKMLVGTLLGTLPGTVVFAMVGSGLSQGTLAPLVLGVACLLIWGLVYGRVLLPKVRRHITREPSG